MEASLSAQAGRAVWEPEKGNGLDATLAFLAVKNGSLQIAEIGFS